MSESLLEDLIAAGTPAKLIAKVAQLEARLVALQEVEEAAAARRAKNTARMRGVRARANTHEHVQHISPQHIDPPKNVEPKKALRIRAHPLPADFAIEEADRECAREAGWDSAKTQAEFTRFVDHARANGRKQVDWRAAWRNWVRSPFQNSRAPPGSAGFAPRPGSKEDQRERTAQAYRKLSDYVDAHADDEGGSGQAREANAGLLPFAKPA